MNPLDPLLAPLPTATEMRDWEKRCFAPGQLSERVVLESAGRAAALAIARHFPTGRVVAAVGAGNNGGDALVALRTLRAWGREVLAIPVPGTEVREDLLHGWEIPSSSDPTGTFRGAGVIVDGILGTGATGAPRPSQAELVRAMNAAGRPVVAVDGPTGVDMTSGQVAGEAVRATLTVTFGAIKRGLLLHPGRQHAGQILLAEVGFPPVHGENWGAELVTDRWAAANLPPIDASAHKTAAGIVAVIAGRTGMGGAAIMAAMGALRAGCGGVRVVSTESNRSALHAAVPEAVFFDRSQDWVDGALNGVRAVLIGPGIGTDDDAREAFRSVLATFSGPLVLDADAITLLAAEPEMLTNPLAERILLTPHPGELGRLLNRSAAEVLEDRFQAAAEVTRRFGCAVLAKGAPSIVVRQGRSTLVAVTGHSGIATGGMGDTLGGVVAAFLAAGADPMTGGALALQLAGRAAEIAGRGRGLLPRDVAEAVPEAIQRLRYLPHSEPMFPVDLPAPA